MATTSHTLLVSLEQYLSTSYTPDMEYKNGELIGRNVGTQKHGTLQMVIGAYILSLRIEFRMIKGFVETRFRMSPDRYVVPDVMVVERPYRHRLEVIDVPAVVIEVKSPTDRFDEIIDKCFEYAACGVPNIIVIDPDSRRQFVFQNDALRSVPASIDLHLPKSNMDLTLPMDRIFEALDNDETD
jgi:Uma2 family endonuclease